MLVPSAALTIGSKLYQEQIIALRLRRTCAPGLDRLEAILPKDTSFNGAPGDLCSLTLDGGDAQGGGGPADVFTGVLTQISHQGESLHLTAHNGGIALSQFRPVVAFEQVGLDKVILTLCREAGVDATVNLDAPLLSLFALDGHATALQEIARLAGLAGGGAAFDGSGVLHVTENGGPEDELALRYGRELLEIRISEGRQPSDPITIVGEGAGSPDTPQARWLSTDFLNGSAPAPGVDARRRRVPELRDSPDTEAAGEALGARRSALARPVRMNTWLMPRLAPGMRLEIADLPDPLSLEDCTVTQVVSSLHGQGWASTEVWALSQPTSGGLLANLGSLL